MIIEKKKIVLYIFPEQMVRVFFSKHFKKFSTLYQIKPFIKIYFLFIASFVSCSPGTESRKESEQRVSEEIPSSGRFIENSKSRSFPHEAGKCYRKAICYDVTVENPIMVIGCGEGREREGCGPEDGRKEGEGEEES